MRGETTSLQEWIDRYDRLEQSCRGAGIAMAAIDADRSGATAAAMAAWLRAGYVEVIRTHGPRRMVRPTSLGRRQGRSQ